MTSLSTQHSIRGNIKVGLLTIAAIASLYAPLSNAAPIYKVVDEQTGQVTFTDRPQDYEQQAGKQVSQMAITTGNETSRSASSSMAGSSDANSLPSNVSQMGVTPTASAAITKTKAPVNYQLAIAEPSKERAYRRPAQSIDVTVQVNPALQADDSVRIYLDDKEVAQGLNASIGTIDVLPGAHTIKVVIQSETGQAIKQVARTVYVIQNNTTLQNNKKIAQQLLAYQNLPWYQKVLLKLRQQEVAQSQ